MRITRKSTLTGITHTLEIPVTQAQLTKWKEGSFIQDAMPNLSEDDREFIMTGITAAEWDAAFSEEKEVRDERRLDKVCGEDPDATT